MKARNLVKAQVPRDHPVDVERAQHDKGAGLDRKDVDPIKQAVADAIDVDRSLLMRLQRYQMQRQSPRRLKKAVRQNSVRDISMK